MQRGLLFRLRDVVLLKHTNSLAQGFVFGSRGNVDSCVFAFVEKEVQVVVLSCRNN